MFTRAYQNWNYVSSNQRPTGGWENWYSLPSAFPENEYLLINSFSMNLLSGDSVGRSIATVWDFPAGQLKVVTAAFSNPYDFHLSAVFAKMVE
ncbi:hypothetical protein D3C80_1661380 [compost metagenome]